MLSPDPLKRPSAKEALIHPFFNDSSKEATKIQSANNLDLVTASPLIPIKDSEFIYKIGSKFGRGFNNLNKAGSLKDFDAI